MGWKPLVNESAPIRRGADSILVTGVNFPETGTNHGRDTGMAGCDMQEVFRSVPPDTYNLLLAHTPEQWDEARSAGDPDLTLSGHVHAMQFKLTLGRGAGRPPNSSTNAGADCTRKTANTCTLTTEWDT